MTRRRKKPKPCTCSRFFTPCGPCQSKRRPLRDFRNVAHGKAQMAEMIAESEKRDKRKWEGKS